MIFATGCGDYDIKTETYTYYNYNNNTYGLNIRDILVTGDIRGFCYICSYENRIVVKLEGENIKIFDENICYFSCEERFDLFLDVCIDTKSINILNDYRISKNKYIEHMVFKENTLIFSENPYEKEMCSGLEKYYSYNLDNKQLNENSIVIAHSIGNAYFIRFCKENNYNPKAYVAVAPGAIYEYPSSRNDYIVEVKKQAYVTEESLNFAKTLIN